MEWSLHNRSPRVSVILAIDCAAISPCLWILTVKSLDEPFRCLGEKLDFLDSPCWTVPSILSAMLLVVVGENQCWFVRGLVFCLNDHACQLSSMDDSQRLSNCTVELVLITNPLAEAEFVLSVAVANRWRQPVWLRTNIALHIKHTCSVAWVSVVLRRP